MPKRLDLKNEPRAATAAEAKEYCQEFRCCLPEHEYPPLFQLNIDRNGANL
jgi:hypothetical protein